MLVAAAPTTPDAAIEGAGANREEDVKSKILSHFIKGKISLTPMETVMMIPGELEHLESLVKVARKKKDAEAASNQRLDSKTNVRDDANVLRHAPGNSDAVDGLSSLWEHSTNEQMIAQEFESDSDSNEDSNEGTQSRAADAEQGKQTILEATNSAEVSMILQVQQMDIANFRNNIEEQIADNRKEDSRWEEICQKIQIDQNQDKEMGAVSKEGTRPDPGKIDAVRQFPEPRIVTSVKSFLGLTGYYHDDATPSVEVMGATEDEELEVADNEQRPQKSQIRYYNRRQQLELVLAAQELSKIGGHEVDPTVSGDEDKCGVETKGSDI
ncbi:unnamed protein product [Sphagnum balticum]